MKKYALIGDHLSHSHSPFVHSEIFKDFNIDATYEKIECTIDELGSIINKLRTGEYSGYNVTIPYKLEVMKYLDEVSPEALEIGAVNTVAYKDNKVIGYNSDYYGFYSELLYYNVEVRDKDCYILGTGGASLAVYKALKDLGGKVLFVSRNPKNPKTISYEELENRNIDVLVNATPVGMFPNVGVSPVKKSIAKRAKYVLDLIFNPKETQILKDANSKMNGLCMLVLQAVKSEEIWQNMEYTKDRKELLERIERGLE